MMPLNNPDHIILDVKRLVESDRRSEIRLNANGGNSILLICEPMREAEYISRLTILLAKENYAIIDLNECVIAFVSHHLPELNELFDQLQSATTQIFKAPSGEDSADLFKEIMKLIQQALKEDKVPVLVNTGSLYGTGIDNLHIIENEDVMNATLPIIILYPATLETGKLMFLGKRPASNYRCMIVQ